ncbi:MAG: heat-inducible transcriptional repressor HrcA [Candidatus Eremiobacteraeota bacterium]|nr:heat-inducible transcriptional repressor HrcA [Candidatus Eremiobacteraeota bacterium]
MKAGSSALNSRQKAILEIIVQEFVKSGEPVGSLIITENYDIGCCSATVRNEMARLEEMGYLEQPHAASGRIPKDKAYRLFVNEIISRKIAPPPENAVSTIEREYQIIQSHLEILIKKTARLLAELTNYTSLLLAPQLRKSLFKYLRLVSLSPTRILLFMMNNTGSIIHRTIELSSPISPEVLERLTNLLNDRLQGRALDHVSEFLKEIPGLETDRELIRNIGDASQHLVEEQQREVFYGGKTRLFDFSEFRDLDKIKVLMEVMEEEKVVAEILTETLNADGVQVLIGEENPVDEMKECSMVTAAYNLNGEPVGTLGIIGPKRMPYEQIISIINYTAENFSHKLRHLDRL